ncbi:MAG: hypothetical protein Q9221_003705 [Calogaya cf. arnoldii]
MGLTKEDLLCHSRWIRDHLAPKIAEDGSLAAGKHFFDLAPLRSALDELLESPMTLDILRFSRMQKALLRIAEAKGGDWPPDIVLKAKDLIARWEISFGPLQRVRTDLWATGGRLEGFAKPRGWFKWESAFYESPETFAWSAGEKRSRAETYKEGHCELKVGESVILIAVSLPVSLTVSLAGGSTAQQRAKPA